MQNAKLKIKVQSFIYLIVGIYCLVFIVSPTWAQTAGNQQIAVGHIPPPALPTSTPPPPPPTREENANPGIINPAIGPFGFQPGNLTIAYLLAVFLRISLIIAGILFLIYLVWGGFKWLMSSGEKAKLTNAKDHITSALAGLILIIFVLVIIGLINEIFRLDILHPVFPATK